jgi:hypothetical protein
MSQRWSGVWQAARFALPLWIPSKSRMRQRARTDLWGGVEQSTSLPRQLDLGSKSGDSEPVQLRFPEIRFST